MYPQKNHLRDHLVEDIRRLEAQTALDNSIYHYFNVHVKRAFIKKFTEDTDMNDGNETCDEKRL